MYPFVVFSSYRSFPLSLFPIFPVLSFFGYNKNNTDGAMLKKMRIQDKIEKYDTIAVAEDMSYL